MSGWVMEADLGRWPETRSSGRSPFRPLLRFWAVLLASSAAAAVTLQLLGPPAPASKPVDALTASVRQDATDRPRPEVPTPGAIVSPDPPERLAVSPAASGPVVAPPQQVGPTGGVPEPPAAATLTPEPVSLPAAADPASLDLQSPPGVPPPQALVGQGAGATDPRSSGPASVDASPKSPHANARSVLVRQKPRPADPVEAALSRLRRQALSRQPRPDRQGLGDEAVAADLDLSRSMAEGSLTNRLGDPQPDTVAGPSGQHWLRLPSGPEPAWDPQVGLDYIR